jgi:hypothetical protein
MSPRVRLTYAPGYEEDDEAGAEPVEEIELPFHVLVIGDFGLRCATADLKVFENVASDHVDAVLGLEDPAERRFRVYLDSHYEQRARRWRAALLDADDARLVRRYGEALRRFERTGAARDALLERGESRSLDEARRASAWAADRLCVLLRRVRERTRARLEAWQGVRLLVAQIPPELRALIRIDLFQTGVDGDRDGLDGDALEAHVTSSLKDWADPTKVTTVSPYDLLVLATELDPEADARRLKELADLCHTAHAMLIAGVGGKGFVRFHAQTTIPEEPWPHLRTAESAGSVVLTSGKLLATSRPRPHPRLPTAPRLDPSWIGSAVALAALTIQVYARETWFWDSLTPEWLAPGAPAELPGLGSVWPSSPAQLRSSRARALAVLERIGVNVLTVHDDRAQAGFVTSHIFGGEHDPRTDARRGITDLATKLLSNRLAHYVIKMWTDLVGKYGFEAGTRQKLKKGVKRWLKAWVNERALSGELAYQNPLRDIIDARFDDDDNPVVLRFSAHRHPRPGEARSGPPLEIRARHVARD